MLKDQLPIVTCYKMESKSMAFLAKHETSKHHQASRGELVYVVRGKDGNKEAWHYVLIDRVKLPLFKRMVKTGSINVTDYGKILYSGWGENPPPEIVEAIQSQYS